MTRQKHANLVFVREIRILLEKIQSDFIKKFIKRKHKYWLEHIIFNLEKNLKKNYMQNHWLLLKNILSLI